MTGPPDIGAAQLAWSLVFVVGAGAASVAFGLGLGRDLFWGTLRTFVQLFVMGYALRVIFGMESAWLTLGVFLLTIVFAARIVRGRVKEPDVAFGVPTFVAMAGSYTLVTFLVLRVVLRAEPWWLPHYLLPLGGMVVGNSMNATALALERLFADLRARRAEVELRLCLGATATEASRTIVRDAVRAGMIPSINAMFGVGLVFIPGMMTGQILAGADPVLAIRYQIVVMLMLAGSTTLCTVLVVLLGRRRCFDRGQRLVLARHRQGASRGG